MRALQSIGLFLFLLSFARAQDRSPLRYEHDFLPAGFHEGRRAEFRRQMPDSSIAVFFSAPERNRSNDTYYRYHQNPNFYYLTGFLQPHAVLLIFKTPFSAGGNSFNEILFIPPRDQKQEVWTGRMASLKEAKEITGIAGVRTTADFKAFPVTWEQFKTVLYTGLPSDVGDDRSDSLDLFDLIGQFRDKFSFPPPNGDSYLAGSVLKRMREIKDTAEITLMKKAIAITCRAHEEQMKVLKVGMTEYQVQAAGEFIFKNSGAEYEGYSSICGGGENSCILHYETNRKTLNDGELLLVDMGAEYHGYTADVTRTLPVNGVFNKSQRTLYELVLQARDSGIAQCRPGHDFRDPDKAAIEVIKKGLFKLGIIDSESSYKTYFMHGTSHYLGLDVHDVGSFGKLKPGNVITVEPGIYIPVGSPCDPQWWNTGIRIEDDILITDSGHENLSQALPAKPAEIEALMRKEPEYFK